MSDSFATLSEGFADAVDRAAQSIVQVHGHRRPAAGVVIAPDLIVAPAGALDGDSVTVRVPSGETREGQVLGRTFSMNLAAARVAGLGLPPIVVAPETRVGSLAIAVGRTWSGNVMASVTNIAVIGGPLRTGRGTQIDRVLRIAQPPHGAFVGGALVDGTGRALGIITGMPIRGTTVVIPSALAWGIGQHLAQQGGTTQGYLGLSSTPVSVPARQRGNRDVTQGLLVTAIVEGSPADSAGLFVGDVLIAFDGAPVTDPEALITLLRGDRVGKTIRLDVLRGDEIREIGVTVGERPRR
jgi:S1-C subfamily serine protease